LLRLSSVPLLLAKMVAPVLSDVAHMSKLCSSGLPGRLRQLSVSRVVVVMVKNTMMMVMMMVMMMMMMMMMMVVVEMVT
jgi:hypothetical protein